MIEFLRGRYIEKNPTNVVMECNGVGYFVNISLYTFSKLGQDESGMIYIHFVVREDAQLLYGFSSKEEREVYRKLISVSGVGPSTGMMIVSTYAPNEVTNIIASEDVNALKAVKGIGAKSAQRIIVDLKDKIGGIEINSENSTISNNTNKIEALSALASLGFDKKSAGKVLDQIIKTEGTDLAVEELIKLGLKRM